MVLLQVLWRNITHFIVHFIRNAKHISAGGWQARALAANLPVGMIRLNISLRRQHERVQVMSW